MFSFLLSIFNEIKEGVCLVGGGGTMSLVLKERVMFVFDFTISLLLEEDDECGWGGSPDKVMDSLTGVIFVTSSKVILFKSSSVVSKKYDHTKINWIKYCENFQFFSFVCFSNIFTFFYLDFFVNKDDPIYPYLNGMDICITRKYINCSICIELFT